MIRFRLGYRLYNGDMVPGEEIGLGDIEFAGTQSDTVFAALDYLELIIPGCFSGAEGYTEREEDYSCEKQVKKQVTMRDMRETIKKGSLIESEAEYKKQDQHDHKNLEQIFESSSVDEQIATLESGYMSATGTDILER